MIKVNEILPYPKFHKNRINSQKIMKYWLFFFVNQSHPKIHKKNKKVKIWSLQVVLNSINYHYPNFKPKLSLGNIHYLTNS